MIPAKSGIFASHSLFCQGSSNPWMGPKTLPPDLHPGGLETGRGGVVMTQKFYKNGLTGH